MDTSAPGAGPFRPVTRRRAFEDVIVQVEDAITDGRLGPGDHLPPERELAQILQVSRSSVREALRVLEAFGVVAARRGRGADAGSVVTAGEQNGLAGLLRIYSTLLKVPLSDLVELRVAIEAMTARAAAERAATGGEIAGGGTGGGEIAAGGTGGGEIAGGAGRGEGGAGLAELAAAMREVSDRDVFLVLDTEFHVALARASGNVLAPLLMEALREAIARQMAAAFRTVADWDATRARIAADHARIADRVEAGDPNGAATAVTEHIRGFYELLHEDEGGATT